MATGAPDANGIYKYGEDDNEPTISQLLNKLADSTSETITRVENMNGLTDVQKATARDNLGVGLVALKPLNIEKSGGTAELLPNGKVTFKTVSFISFNEIFTLDYDYYMIVIGGDHRTSVAGMATTLKLRHNGADQSSGYFQNGTVQYGASGSSVYALASDSPAFDLGAAYPTTSSGIILELINPRQAQQTIMHSKSQGAYAGQNASYNISGINAPNFTASGFTLKPAGTATIDGTVEVFAGNR